MCNNSKKGKRNLVWYEDFCDNAIDFDKWQFRRTMFGYDRQYDNTEKHARIENNNMVLCVNRNNNSEKPWSLPQGLTTYNTMLFKYGYLEMRARIPFQHGAWPSFWMQSNTDFKSVSWFSEVDIFEVFSSDCSLIANLHKWSKDKHSSLDKTINKKLRTYVFDNIEKLNEEYHIYGFEWNPDYMRFFVDDVKFAEFSITKHNCLVPNDVINGVEGFHDFHFIIFNNEIFTPKGGYVVDEYSLSSEDPIPINYYIDWVRLYQKDGEEIMLKKEIDSKLAK